MVLSKTLEKCVQFARFASEHEIEASILAGIMQLCHDMEREKRYAKKQTLRYAIHSQMTGMGFCEIAFNNASPHRWFTFQDKDDRGRDISFPKL